MSINYEHTITSDTGLYAPVDNRYRPALEKSSNSKINEVGGSLLVALLCLGLLGIIG